jgi:NAD(P)-dependent dehydrogenase (short-subunit alcohol dehydrogenase family)
LARDGAAVTITGRHEDRLQEACAILAEEDLELRYAVCDALVGDEVRRAIDVASDGGELHIAVAGPGCASFTPVLLFGDDQLSEEVDANLRPVFLALKYAGQAMVRAGGGSFVAVSAQVGVMAARFLGSLSVGKAAVDQLVRVAANELGEVGIRVNAVRPGGTKTPGNVALRTMPGFTEAVLANQAIARQGEVEDVAAAIRYFAGPESSWVTGEILTVDGGNTLRDLPDWRQFFDLSESVRDAPED